MNVQIDFDTNLARLKRAYETTDDIGTVIRVHYELERCLTHVIEKTYKNPRKLGASRAGPKIERLEALGYGGPEIELARAIDDIRNAVAHRDQEELREVDIERLDAIFKKLPSKCSLADFNIRLWGKTVSYSEMLLRQRFCIFGGTAIMGLAALPVMTAAAIATLLRRPS